MNLTKNRIIAIAFSTVPLLQCTHSHHRSKRQAFFSTSIDKGRVIVVNRNKLLLSKLKINMWTWSPLNFSHTEVLRSSPQSFLKQHAFLLVNPYWTMALLDCPDIVTAQIKLCRHNIKVCPVTEYYRKPCICYWCWCIWHMYYNIGLPIESPRSSSSGSSVYYIIP